MSQSLAPIADREIIAERFRAVADARRAEQDALDDEADPWVRADTQADLWLRSSRYVDSTREQYRAIYKSWRIWCAMINIPPFDTHRSDLDAYTLALETIGNPAARHPKPVSRRTVLRHMAAISSFYRRAIDDGKADRNPVPAHDRPVISRKSRQPHLDAEELRTLIHTADLDGPRSAALVTMLVLACMRISEALNADLEDIGREKDSHVLWVRRKGGKEEFVALPPEVYGRIMAAAGGRREGPIIATASGMRVDRKAAWKIMRRLGRRAHIAASIGPHTLRHAYITRGHELKLPITDLQDAAGHANTATTRGYDRSQFDPARHPSFIIARDLLRVETDQPDSARSAG